MPGNGQRGMIMKNGFIKMAAGTPKIQVADCIHNTEEILRLVKEMERKIEKLKAEMELTVKKIEAIDENLE